jgi:hypothetical protein
MAPRAVTFGTRIVLSELPDTRNPLTRTAKPRYVSLKGFARKS